MEFHSEDYIRFMQRINPGIIDDYKEQMMKCNSTSSRSRRSCLFK